MQDYSVLMSAPAAIAILEGPTHVFRIVNDNYKKLVGASRELVGKTVKQAFPELEGQGFYDLLDTVYTMEEPYIGNETPLQLVNTVTGELEDKFINFIYQPIIDNGAVTGIFVHATDVTETVTGRKEIEQARERYKMVLASVDEGFCIIRMIFNEAGKPVDYFFVETNSNFEAQTGLKDAQGKTALEMIPNLEQHWFDLYGGVATTGESIQFSQDSEEMGRWFDVQATRVGLPEENLVAILFKDVTEKRRLDLEQVLISRQLSDVLESTNDAFFMLDKDWNVLRVNKKYEEVSQMSRETSVGKNFWKLFPAADIESSQYYVSYHRVMETRQPESFVEYFAPLSLWTEVDVYPSGQGSISIFFRDITAAKIAERDLQRIKRRYDALFNSNTVALATASMKGEVLEANNNFLKLFGYTRSDLKKGITSAHVTAPSDVNGPKMFAAIKAKGESLPLERRYLKKDGTEFPALVGCVSLPGDAERFVSFIIDTSENEQLKELNRTKDEFIALASHQLRTPATAVKQYLGIVMEEYAGPITPDQLQYLNIANNANDRQLTLIDDLLKTARIDTRGFGLTLTPHDLRTIVIDVIRQYKPMIESKNQTLSFADNGKPAIVPFDATEMSVCIANLIENASKYSPTKTVVSLGLSQTSRYVELRVTDAGVGIAAKDVGKIFEKFTRIHNELSDTASGSGLGLYWVKRIIDIHKGTLKIDSKVGEGSTFTIRLKK